MILIIALIIFVVSIFGFEWCLKENDKLNKK